MAAARRRVFFCCAHSITQVYRHVNTFLQNIFKNLKYNAVSSMFFCGCNKLIFCYIMYYNYNNTYIA